jgi:hypothetical protein
VCEAYCDDFIGCGRGLAGPVDVCRDDCRLAFFSQGFDGTNCGSALDEAEGCFDALDCNDAVGHSLCLAQIAGAGNTCGGLFDPGPCDCGQCERPALASLCQGFSNTLCKNAGTTQEQTQCCQDQALAACAE